MSKNFYKLDYECNCHPYYGCSKTSSFIIVSHNVSDIWVVLQREHPDGKLKKMLLITREEKEALAELFAIVQSKGVGSKFTEQDHKDLDATNDGIDAEFHWKKS